MMADDWKELAKATRKRLEEGENLGSGRFRRPPVNATLVEIYARILDGRIIGDLAAGTQLWDELGFRFVIRKYWYQIRSNLWKLFTRRGPAG